MLFPHSPFKEGGKGVCSASGSIIGACQKSEGRGSKYSINITTCSVVSR